MSEVNVRPGDPQSTHDLSLAGGGQVFGIRFSGSIDESLSVIPDKSRSTISDEEGKRWGDWEPGHSHVQQADWVGGRGLKTHSSDKTKFFDSQNAITYVPGKILPSYQWKIAAGAHRDHNHSLAGNVNWVALLSSDLYTSNVFQTSAAYNTLGGWLWVRRVGNPGTLTYELCSNSSGDPGTVLKTVTATTSDITDVVSVWYNFVHASQALTISTNYHVKVYGASTDNAQNHWEIGVNFATNEARQSSDNITWNDKPGYSLYYRIEDDTAARKFHPFFVNKGDMYVVDQPSGGNSTIYKWDETNDDFDAQTLGGDALTGVVKSVAVSKDIAHMARGSGGADGTIFTFDYSGPTGQDDATSTNKADVVLAGNHKDDGPQIWRAENATWVLSRSDTKAFNTDLVFGDDIPLDKYFDVLSMIEHKGIPFVRTQDGLHFIYDDKIERVPVGLDHVIEPATAVCPMLSKDLFIYFGWSHSLERYHVGSETIDDTGPWRGEGLPQNRRGPISGITSAIGGYFISIDAGSTGISGVYFWNERGFHEVYRAPKAGLRCYNVWWQSVSGAKPRLWVSVGPDLVYMELPENVINPLHDTTVNYMHEAVVISSTIDMDAVALPKAFREIVGWLDNIITGIDVQVDYQVDDDVGTTNWIHAGGWYRTGENSIQLSEGNRRIMRYRLRLRTNDSDKPPVVEAVVMEGFMRAPWKPQMVLQLKTGSYQVTWQGVRDHDPNDLLEFLVDASLNAVLFNMRCIWPFADDKWVTIEPSSIFPEFVDRNNGNWQGNLRLTLSIEG